MASKEAGVGAALLLEMRGPVVVGLSTLAALRVSNTSDHPQTVSHRLNLMEGDVQLSVEGAEGTKVFKGWQADTSLRRAVLQPGEQIVGAINLLHTPEGPVFPRPGRYVIRALYSPNPRSAPILSPPVAVVARLPLSGSEKEAAELLTDDTLRQAIALAQPEEAKDGLRKLASVAGPLLDPDLARLLVQGHAEDSQVGSRDPIQLAMQIKALSTPYSSVGDRLASELVEQLHADAVADTTGRTSPAEIAARIVRGDPLRVD